MRKIHAQAFLEAEQHPQHDILVLVRNKGRTRPALPKELHKYIKDTDYAPNSHWTIIKWHNGSSITLRLVTEKMPSDRAKLYLFDGDPEDWFGAINQEDLDGFLDSLEITRFYNKELTEDLSLLVGKDVHPYNCTPKWKFISCNN